MNKLFSLMSVCLTLVVSAYLITSVAHADNWSRFRGPNGTGIAHDQNLPDMITEEHISWVKDLPGMGHAAPVIWGNKLFVTSATEGGLTRSLYCLDAATGDEQWVRTIEMNRSHKHQKSSWASSTPTTDGELVYVSFADKEQYRLYAYDFTGQKVWERSLGQFESQHGQGTSPILYKNMIFLANDQDGPSTVVAFDKKTGETIWSTERQSRRVSYATPLLLKPQNGEPAQLIVSCGAMGITSLNPETGDMFWQTGEFDHRTVGSPIYSDGMIVQTCGGGGQGKYLIAINPHAAKPDESQPEFETLYERKKRLPYVPTPVAYQGHLYLCNDGGIANCLDLKTGKNIWTKRIGGKYTSSPICVDGKLYMLSEEGELVVISASPEYKLWGKLKLNDPSHSTPSAANGRLYVRTFHKLFALGKQK